MFSAPAVLGMMFAFFVVLFGVALWWERLCSKNKFAGCLPIVYSLSFSTYVTAWAYYGDIGSTVHSGYLFVAGEVSTICSAFLWWIVLRKMVRVKSRYHITNIADYISTRYGKSRTLGFIVSAGCVLLLVPYIALQIHALVATFSLLTNGAQEELSPFNAGLSVLFTAIMAGGALVFGLRKIDPSEHQPGLLASIAVQAVFRLFVLLAAGVFVTYFLFNGLGDVFSKSHVLPSLRVPLEYEPGFYSEWVLYLLISMFAVLFLPHQFHVTVVENQNEKHILTAMWLFPLYNVLIVFFVVPIAIAGLALGVPASMSDFLLIQIPILANQKVMALMVFLGGVASASGMAILALTTTSLMFTNYALLPALDSVGSRYRWARWLGALQRSQFLCRSLSVLFMLGLVLLFLSRMVPRPSLYSIGTQAFVATSQFAPAVLGGLFWQRGTKRGVLLGLSAGFLLWTYTLVIPTLQFDGHELGLIRDGPMGIGFLRPHSLFGLSALTPMGHSLFWSLFSNTILFVIGSLTSRQSAEEVEIASDFILGHSRRLSPALPKAEPSSILLSARIAAIRKGLQRYLRAEEAEKILNTSLHACGVGPSSAVTLPTFVSLMREIERKLGGAIGSAQAHRALEVMNVFRPAEIDDFGRLIGSRLANIGLTPAELLDKVDYFEERNAILHRHALDLQRSIQDREREAKLRKIAEESQTRLAAVLEETSDFVAMFDEDGKVIYLNRSAKEFLGLRPKDPIERLSFRDLHPPEAVRMLKEVAIPAATLSRLWRGESQFRGANGRVIEASQVLIAHKRADGSVHYFSTVARDISAQKRTEQELRRAIDASEAANRLKNDLLATVSHELRTPLNSIIGGAELLIAEAGALNAKGDLELILRNGLLLKSIIEDILSFAQLSAGKLQLVSHPLSLKTLVDDVVRTLKPLAAQKGIALTSRISVEVHDHVESDSVRIKQVLLNLAGNAIKFTSQGGVSIEITASPVTSGHQSIRFEVVDTGIGIRREEQERIFQPFTQAESTLERHFGGAGMGLAISKRLVELMKGEIGVTSEVGQGSRFWFVLPLKLGVAKEESVEQKANFELAQPGSVKVLLADDSRDNQFIVARMLKRFGVECDTVENGLQAVEAAERKFYDLVLMDIMMPVMNGIEAIKRIRSLPAPNRFMPIVALSARISADDIHTYLEAGANDALAKPLTRDALKDELHKFMPHGQSS